jgi:DNA repair ATPase RecN
VNIDERLEVLTQTVEFMASLHKDCEQRFQEYAQATEVRFSKLAQAVERNEERAGQLMDTMNRLGRILEMHDETLDEHDERINRLEGPEQ